MIPGSVAAKNTARVNLNNKWPQSIAVIGILLSVFLLGVFIEQLLYTILKTNPIFSVFNPENWNNLKGLIYKIIIDVVGTLFTIIIVSPLLLGTYRWFWRMTCGADDSVSSIFIYFSTVSAFFRAVRFNIYFYLRVLIVGVLAFLPYISSAILINHNFYEQIHIKMPQVIETLWALPASLFIVGFVIFIPLVVRYYLAPIILFNDDAISPGKAFRISAKISKGSKMGFSMFLLSFFVWFLLSVLAIPLMFVLPLFLSSCTVYSRYVINSYNRRIMMQNHAEMQSPQV